jgi:lipoprotein-anchoring transpeptidase ErfK/SrfK
VFSGWSPTSTGDVPLAKSIHVNLKKQILEELVNGIVIQTYRVSTGKASTPTPRGHFSVLNKAPKAWSKSAGLWMPYWMAYDGKGRGLHELPIWPSGYREGANHLGVPVSHGCIRLGIGPAKQLYDWSPIGTPVFID